MKVTSPRYQGVSGYIFFSKSIVLLSEIVCICTSSEDPDEIQHYAAFHLDLHCLQKYTFRVFQL